MNNMREGALDKVVYEAAATCMPVLASNTGFDDLLPPELRFARDDAADLADEAPRASQTRRPQRARPRAARAGSRRATRSSTGPDGLLEVARR